MRLHIELPPPEPGHVWQVTIERRSPLCPLPEIGYKRGPSPFVGQSKRCRWWSR